MIEPHRLFHTGIRVPDLDAAIDELGRALGVTWAAVQRREQPIWTPATGLVTVPLRFTYSCEGPVHLELLEGVVGSFWDGITQPGAHHLGYWVNDVAGTTKALQEQGWELVGASGDPDVNVGAFTYLAPPSGLIVELVTELAEPMFQRWWAGGLLG